MPTLTRTHVACPHADCPANLGQAAHHVVSHASFRTKAGTRRRRRCRVCGRTFSATTGTAYERLRSRPGFC